MGIKIHELATKSGDLGTSDYLAVDNGTVTAKIDYTKLAKAILDVYSDSNLNTSAKTVVGAVNELRANANMLLGGTDIPANTDLNTLTAIGNYSCGADGNAQTLVHSPTKSGFVMKVSTARGNDTGTFLYRRQRVTKYNSAETWERTMSTSNSGSTWAFTSWTRIVTGTEMDASWANYGCKNLLPNVATTQTINGVTFTVNSDGSVTANGTATATAHLVLATPAVWNALRVPAGIYTISGSPAVSGCYIIAQFYDGSTQRTIQSESGNEASGNYSAKPTLNNSNIFIRVKNGVTVSNVTFYPMIRPANIPDDTYVPYAPTNAELAQLVNKLKIVRIDNRTSHAIKFSTYATAAFICTAISNSHCVAYIFANGYLAPIATSDIITATLSDDYLTVTVTNNSTVTNGYLMVIGENIESVS